MSFDPNRITFFAKTDARAQNTPFGIKAIDRTRHVYVIGKTGMGKSTLLENMAVQDMKNGEGLAFIDPHGATAETLLDYIPEERKNDVLYFAPFDTENPISFNVMEDVGPDKRHLVVSGLMSVFKKIWVDVWSARMEYILQNTLLALLEYPDSTLLGVNRMLSDKNYRKAVIANISDPAVKSFWVDEFLNYNERYMQEAGDSIKNKIGQFTANPLIRNIIGQPKSSFDIRKMMDEKKIIIMNLSKGLVGESNANLLGSMLTTRIYLAAMSRADMSQKEMKETPPFYFYVDEFQSFANATFADILSEARKYKLNLTIAHQYIEQMEEEVRNAVFGNVGTIISFRVGPFDAEVLETIYAPQFYAVDICNLGFAQVYLTLMIDGIGSPPFSAVTLPPIELTGASCKDIVIHTSRKQYAKVRNEVEASINEWHEKQYHIESKSNGREGGKNSGRNESKNIKRDGNGTAGARRQEGSRGASERKSEERTVPRERERISDSSPRNEERSRTSISNVGQSGNRDIPKDKSLDDLRSVLAGLSKQSEDKENKKELKVPEKKDDDRLAKNTRERPREKPPSDPAVDLKKALASIVREQPKQDIGDKTEKIIAPSVSVVPKQERSAPVVENKPEVSEVDMSGTSSKGPIDPKVLERMMRPKSSDRSPLK